MGKKYAKRNRKNKRNRKKNSRSGSFMPIQRGIISQRQHVTFKFHTEFQLDASAVSIAYDTISANSIFDPYTPIGGKTVLGFDQWMVFYNNYTVMKSTIKATFIPSSSSVTLSPQLCGIQLLPQVTPITVLAAHTIEQKYTKYKLMTGHDAKGYQTVSHTFTPQSFLGVKDPLDEDDLSGAFNANPDDQAYFNIFTAPYSAFYNPDPCNVMVDVTYHCILHEPKDLPIPTL